MQLSGLLHGAKLLRFVNFPVPEVLGPDASEAEIKAMIDRHGMVFIKPIFKGAIGKKGKAGLVGKARDLKTALAERERLYFVQHTPRQRHRQGAGRHLRGGGAGRARGLFRDRRFDPLPGAHDHHHPSWRRRHRGAGQGRDRQRAVRGADRPQGVRHRQRAGRHRRAAARSSRRWSSICRGCGSWCTISA